MKTLNLQIPETLKEFRSYYCDRNIQEFPIDDDHPYNSKRIGWELFEDSGTINVRLLARSNSLIGAYKKLFKKELYL